MTYIALLRGINVGGNILRMDRLRAVWQDLGKKPGYDQREAFANEQVFTSNRKA